MIDDTRPPSNFARAREVAALLPRVYRGFGHLGPRGPAGGPKCLVLPGFIATDRTSMELRRAFAAAGWHTFGWNMGLNRGARADTLDRLAGRLREVAGDDKVLLVGWSLGGVFARELARAVPDAVTAVVTLGSPFSGDPRWNNVWRLYERVAGHRVDAPPIARVEAKPPVPTLALWSRRDGIVAPRAAFGLDGERDEAVEVGCTHMGFAVARSGTRQVVGETRRFLERLGLPVPRGTAAATPG
jgi:pimeloyl-ACP methyl ester carboxylesterase